MHIHTHNHASLDEENRETRRPELLKNEVLVWPCCGLRGILASLRARLGAVVVIPVLLLRGVVGRLPVSETNGTELG